MKLPVSHLVPGMKLARPVYGRRGELLLNHGAVLTARYIFKLRECGVLAVHVEASGLGLDELEAQQALEDQVRAEAVAAVRAWAESGRRRSFAVVVETVKAIIDEILAGRTFVNSLAEISSVDSYTFAHSVDVCVLSVSAGLRLGYGREELLKLGIGGLLHDLGKTKVPPEILNKPGKLTPGEFAQVRKHPLWGYKMLLDEVKEQIDPKSMGVILNHHERYDGSGYPRGLKKGEIGEMAAVCAVADVYNAMTTDRVYRAALPPHEVYEMLMGAGGTMFDFKVVRAFLTCIEPYPVGSLVRLNSGDIACVLAVDQSLPFRPTVVLIPSGERVDLKRELSLVIVAPLTADEVRRLIVSGARNVRAVAEGGR